MAHRADIARRIFSLSNFGSDPKEAGIHVDEACFLGAVTILL